MKTCIKFLMMMMIAGPCFSLAAISGFPPLPSFYLPALPGDGSAQILLTGSWDLRGSMINRGDLRIGGLGFQLRAQVVDKRPAQFWEDWPRAVTEQTGNTAFGGGIYHNQTGSRLIYGLIEEWGLSARLRNPWGKSLPFSDARRPQGGDLRTEPLAKGTDEAYLYLGSPRFGPFGVYASAQVSHPKDGKAIPGFEALNPGFSAGLDARFSSKQALRIEGFFAERLLEPYSPSAWFSAKPPLPERKFALIGLGLLYAAPRWSIAGDGAYSETVALGQGWYGNLAFRLGDRPWRLSLGAEAAVGAFSGRDGANAGPGLRSAAQLEWKGKRSALFRLNTTLQSPEVESPFNRSSSRVYVHFPSNWGTKKTPVAFRPQSVRLVANRNAQDPQEILDSLEGTVALAMGQLGFSLHGTLSGISEDKYEGPITWLQMPPPYPASSSYSFKAGKASAEVSYRLGPFQFRLKLGYAAELAKEASPVASSLEGSLYASLGGKLGRISLKIGLPPLPLGEGWTMTDTWDCTLSYRMLIRTQ